MSLFEMDPVKSAQIEERVQDLLSRMTLEEKIGRDGLERRRYPRRADRFL